MDLRSLGIRFNHEYRSFIPVHFYDIASEGGESSQFAGSFLLRIGVVVVFPVPLQYFSLFPLLSPSFILPPKAR